jgi:hypothetical protein
MMSKLKLKIEGEMADRIVKVASVGGYSSAQEFVLHVLERELEKLDPGQVESEEEIRRKMEGLGYIE